MNALNNRVFYWLLRNCDILPVKIILYIHSGVAWVFFLVRQFARGVRKLKQNGRLKRIFQSLNGYFMISIITEITRRKLFRYASNDCVCEFIAEPWERLHEASSRVSDRIYICNRKKNRVDKINLYLRADSSAPGVLPPPPPV